MRVMDEAEAPRTRVLPRPSLLRRPFAFAYAAILLGIVVRAAHVLAADFPLNDGGLFYLMTREVQASDFHLPAFTNYNGGQIPFAYSPLGFYLAAAINSATGIPLMELFRFLPLVATSLLVVAYYRLAKAMLGDPMIVGAAVLAFALVPRSFGWMIMGGGLTRSLGLLAAVAGMYYAHQMYTRREWRYALGAVVACAVTVLSHLGTAPFLAMSIALLFAFYGRHRFGLVSSAVVAGATIVLTAPWWATVIATHGVAPFIAAQNTAGSALKDVGTLYEVLLRLARFNLLTTGEPLFPIFGFFAILGAFAALRAGWFILVVWWVLVVFSDVRAGETYATIPGGMLAGIGIVVVFIPLLRSLYPETPAPSAAASAIPGPSPSGRPILPPRLIPRLLVGFFFVYGVISALSRSPDYGAGLGPNLTALRPEERALMRDLAERTAPASRFIVVTGQPWFSDKVAEWFPVLANRVSVNTVQGSEWLPGGFFKRVDENIAVQGSCADGEVICLEQWAASTGRAYTHVYVAKSRLAPCCARLMASLRANPTYTILHDSPAAMVAARRVGIAAR